MVVTVIPIVNGVLPTITKGLVERLKDLKIRGRVETIQTTAMLRSATILRRFEVIYCYSNSSEKASAEAGVKNFQNNSNNNNNNNRNQVIWQKSYQRNKNLSSSLCKILRTFLKMDKGGNSDK